MGGAVGRAPDNDHFVQKFCGERLFRINLFTISRGMPAVKQFLRKCSGHEVPLTINPTSVWRYFYIVEAQASSHSRHAWNLHPVLRLCLPHGVAWNSTATERLVRLISLGPELGALPQARRPCDGTFSQISTTSNLFGMGTVPPLIAAAISYMLRPWPDWAPGPRYGLHLR